MLDLECSLGGDFVVELDADAEISSLNLAGQLIPVRRDDRRLIIPTRPGRQSVELAWRTADPMKTVAGIGSVRVAGPGANVTSVLQVPESRWILWAGGPLRGPAVRFWTILACADSRRARFGKSALFAAASPRVGAVGHRIDAGPRGGGAGGRRVVVCPHAAREAGHEQVIPGVSTCCRSGSSC